MAPDQFASLFSQAHPTGWGHFPAELLGTTDVANRLLTFCQQWGQPVPSRDRGDLIDILQPRATSEARPRTLSAEYGVGRFPFHNDTAHWPEPCRLICLACIDPGPAGRATLLIPLQSLQTWNSVTSKIATGIFRVRNGRRSFYSSIVSPGRPWIRYDPGCMTPESDGSAFAWNAMQGLLDASNPIRVEWQAGDILVLDNWWVLHARDESPSADPTRRLARVLLR